MLVCCALGYSRSAAAIAVWMLMTGRAPDLAAAEAAISAVRPRIVLGERAHEAMALAAGRAT